MINIRMTIKKIQSNLPATIACRPRLLYHLIHRASVLFVSRFDKHPPPWYNRRKRKNALVRALSCYKFEELLRGLDLVRTSKWVSKIRTMLAIQRLHNRHINSWINTF